MLIVTGQREAAFLLKTVKRMLYLDYVLLPYLLLYNLKVSFNFHLTLVQLNVIKIFTVQYKLFFILLSAIFSELRITRTFFLFPLKVRVTGRRRYSRDGWRTAFLPGNTKWHTNCYRLYSSIKNAHFKEFWILILQYNNSLGAPWKRCAKIDQSRNAEAKNRESNRTVIIMINREFD